MHAVTQTCIPILSEDKLDSINILHPYFAFSMVSLSPECPFDKKNATIWEVSRVVL